MNTSSDPGIDYPIQKFPVMNIFDFLHVIFTVKATEAEALL